MLSEEDSVSMEEPEKLRGERRRICAGALRKLVFRQ